MPPLTYKFTGKERDTETGNDDFGARYYSNRFGRWLSAGWSSVPAPVPYANLTNPQTLNLYAMVSDDPESFADLDGHTGAGYAGNPNWDGEIKGYDASQLSDPSLLETPSTLTPAEMDALAKGQAQQSQTTTRPTPPPTPPSSRRIRTKTKSKMLRALGAGSPGVAVAEEKGNESGPGAPKTPQSTAV